MAKLLVVCFVLLSLGAMDAAAKRAEGNCEKDLHELMTNCQGYLKFPAEPKVAPSEACCGVVQKVDVPCLCSMVTPQVEQYICMDKAVYVADYCKRPFLPGSSCGSYHVAGPVA